MTIEALAEAAIINPKGPTASELASDELCDFVPMAAVGEDGSFNVLEERPYAEVMKGFTAFQNGDVLLAKITPCFENNKIALANTRTKYAFGSTEFHVVRPVEGRLDAKYLLHFLRQDRIRFLGEHRMTGSAGQRRVPKGFLAELEIPLPPIDKQRRIAAILDKADAIRRKHEQALTLADGFLKSTFLAMFGDLSKNDRDWEKVALADHIIHSNNGMSRRRKTSQNVGSIVLRLQDVRENSIDYEECNRIPLDDSERRRFKLEEEDLLFVRVNGNREYVGRCAIFSGHSEEVFHNDHLIRLRLGQRFDPYFLAYLFNLEVGRYLLSGSIKTSAGQHTISQDGLKKIEFPAPPEDLQRKFRVLSDRMRKDRKILELSAVEAEELFASLSQRAFRGEL